MKFIFIFLSLYLLHFDSLSQTADTIRVYTHTNNKEHWSITTKNKTQYTFFSVDSNSMEDIAIGTLKISDTAIRFICDTSKLHNKDLINHNYTGNSEISRILKGKTFGLFENYLLPLDENSLANEKDSAEWIYNRFILGDGYGVTIIELKPSNQYSIYSMACLDKTSESGKWTLNSNIITCVPDEGDHKVLDWFSIDRKFVYTGKYLISRNVGEMENIVGENSIIETYFYFSGNPQR